MASKSFNSGRKGVPKNPDCYFFLAGAFLGFSAFGASVFLAHCFAMVPPWKIRGVLGLFLYTTAVHYLR